MIVLFYTSGFFAIATTLCVILNTNPIYALLFLIASLLFVSLNLFVLRAPFAAFIEIIIYAGAIMVLFVFAIMMMNTLNIDSVFNNIKVQFLSGKICVGILLLMSNLLMILLYVIFKKNGCFINIFQSIISLKQVGITLFDRYILVIEIASFLLLSALISVLHITQECNVYTNFTSIHLPPEFKK